eukprot:1132665-Alexandrium_andersonii.AAC.1
MLRYWAVRPREPTRAARRKDPIEPEAGPDVRVHGVALAHDVQQPAVRARQGAGKDARTIGRMKAAHLHTGERAAEAGPSSTAQRPH